MSGDPYRVLGLAPDASDEEVRAAYVQRVKEHPPDRSPEEFERIRDAYAELRDPRRRAQALAALDPLTPFAALLAGVPPRRPFLGPGPWRRLLDEGSQEGSQEGSR